MKKIFKAISVLAATAALGAGVALASGCSAGYSGKYYGEYHYANAYGVTYGMVVEVTVENNIITNVRNLTNSDDAHAKEFQKGADGKAQNWVTISSANEPYGWPQSMVDNWNNHESWLMQQYRGWAVADILDIEVFTDYGYVPSADGGMVPDTGISGEPYLKEYNSQLAESGLLITNATQGSGRVILAVQDALTR